MSDDKLDRLVVRAAMAECGHTDYDREHNFGAMNPATRETRVKAIRAALDEAVAEDKEGWQAEAKRVDAEIAEFGRPLPAEGGEHEIRDWLTDVWQKAVAEERRALLEIVKSRLAHTEEPCRACSLLAALAARDAKGMIHFCANVDCGRGFSDCGPAQPPKGWTPPTLCPSCRLVAAGRPLSCRVGGRLPGEPETPEPARPVELEEA